LCWKEVNSASNLTKKKTDLFPQICSRCWCHFGPAPLWALDAVMPCVRKVVHKKQPWVGTLETRFIWADMSVRELRGRVSRLGATCGAHRVACSWKSTLCLPRSVTSPVSISVFSLNPCQIVVRCSTRRANCWHTISGIWLMWPHWGGHFHKLQVKRVMFVDRIEDQIAASEGSNPNSSSILSQTLSRLIAVDLRQPDNSYHTTEFMLQSHAR
jgi:hypothetical protein